jgi:hypothetical protein
MADVAAGFEEMNSLRQAGFNDTEIDQWRTETAGQLQDAGFNSKEVDDYFGDKTPDLSSTEKNFKTNLMAKREAKAAETAKPADPQTLTPKVKEAETFLEAIEAGFDMSVTGLIRDRPDVVLPENAPMYYRIASQVSQLAGDVPAMIAGGVAGGAGGVALGTATLPVVGTIGFGAAGAGAGAFALPEAMRTTMMEHYEKGDVKSFSDFWERTSAVAINSLKAGTIGAATAGVGGAVTKVVGKAALPAITKTSAVLASEVTTMVTVGAALEGKIPEPQEFLDAAILVGGLHGSVKAAGKIRGMYAKKGMTPVEVAERADVDPAFRQQILSETDTALSPEGLNALPETVSTTKPLREPNPNLSAEVNTILGKVGEQPEAAKKGLTKEQVYTKLVDGLDPLNEGVKTLIELKKEATGDADFSLPAEKNSYILGRTSVDYKSKARHMFEKGLINYETLENTGPSLRSTLEKVDSIDVLNAYRISKRAIEKNKQGLKTGFDIAAAEKVVAEHKAQYEVAAKEMTEFSDGVIDYVTDAGLLSKEQNARFKESGKDYVPFKRLMDPAESGATGKGRGKGGSLKAYKGSEGGIQDPVISTVENTIELVRMAEVNRAKRALVALAAEVPGQEIIKRVPDRLQAIEVKASEIIGHLEDSGAITTIKSIREDLKSKGLAVSDEAVLKAFEQQQGITETSTITDLTIFRKQQTDLAPNQFAVYKDGKRTVYETSLDIAEAVARLDGDRTSTHLLFKVLNGITTVKKIGITFTPDFIARNAFRDWLTGNVFSEGKITPLDVLSGMGVAWEKGDRYWNWVKSGGANGAFLELNDAYIKKDIYKLQRETNFMNGVRNLVEKPIDFLRLAAEISEQGVRIAEFEKVRKKGGSYIEAGYASRQVTIDFQRRGSSAKLAALSSATAFLNVSIQGLDRTVQAVKDNPKAVITKSVASITVPSMLLWWANHDDDRYKETPQWERDVFWVIPTDNWKKADPSEAAGLPVKTMKDANGNDVEAPWDRQNYVRTLPDGTVEINNGIVYRLPKPPVLGQVFGSLMERSLTAYFDQDPEAFREFDKSMLDMISLNVVPDAITPVIEQKFNKSLFTGQSIIPEHLVGISGEYQAQPYTSETAKTLGKMVAKVDKDSGFASPLILDNYIRSWGGALGQYAVQIADKALVKTGVAPDNVAPTATLSDIPFIKAFVVRYPRAGSESVNQFYENYEKSQKVINTIKFLAKEGDFASMDKELNLKANQDKLVSLDGIKEALTAQSKLIRDINKNPDMTPDDKLRLIHGAYMQMTQAAKQGNIFMSEIRKSVGE